MGKKEVAPQEGRGRRIRAFEELRRLKSMAPDKKNLVVRDITRVLSDIEESKRSKKVFYFSGLQGRAVADSSGRRVGRLEDLAISGGSAFPEVSHALIRSGRSHLMIPWKSFSGFGERLLLNGVLGGIQVRGIQDDDVFLARNILDKQVVDVNGLKVIRVNDIVLAFIQERFVVVSIDVGSRSILRRLGLHSLAEKVPGFSDHPVPWGSVEPLTRSLEKIHLKVPCARVSDLHPADVAEVFEELSTMERKLLLRSMKREKAAKVILECEPEIRTAIIKSLKAKRLAAILEIMPPGDAANLISEFDRLRQEFLLRQMGAPSAGRVQEMLAYKAGTVARYMTPGFISVRLDMTAGDAIDYIRALKARPDKFHYIYIVDGSDVLKGVISLKNLLVADPSAVLRKVLVHKVASVEISDPIEYAEDLISKYDLLSLPVVDINGRVRGIVSVDDVLDLIVERSKARKPFELSDETRHRIRKEKRVKDYYATIFKDIGHLFRDLEPTGLVRKGLGRKK